MKIYTVGYEGTSIEEFVSFLKRSGIERIADLRKNPVSRKKGFSKNRMAENLSLDGIEYIHLPGLGVPREWRKAAKNEEITRAKMFRDFVKKILPVETDNLSLLKKLHKEKPTALLCYEADASDCHRRLVADELVRTSGPRTKIIDLNVHGSVDTKGLTSIMHDRKPARSRKLRAAGAEL